MCFFIVVGVIVVNVHLQLVILLLTRSCHHRHSTHVITGRTVRQGTVRYDTCYVVSSSSLAPLTARFLVVLMSRHSRFTLYITTEEFREFRDSVASAALCW